MDVNVTPAAQVIVSLFPIVGIIMATLLLFFYLLWHHKETIMRIKHGIYNPLKLEFLNLCLLSGILLTILGLTLTVFFVCIHTLDYTLLLGLSPFAIGVSLLIYYKITNRKC